MISPLVFQMAEGSLQTEFGKFKVTVYNDGNVEATVLQTLELNTSQPLHIKIQSTCITSHYFNSIECSCRKDSESFQEYISIHGNGLLVLLNQEGRANGNVAHIASQDIKATGVSQDDAYIELGFPIDSRDYRIVPKILSSLDVQSCILHSDNKAKLSALQKANIKCNSFNS